MQITNSPFGSLPSKCDKHSLTVPLIVSPKILEISKIDGLSAIYGYITPIIITSTFKSKRHGCVERSYYTLLKYYKSKGAWR